MLKKFMIEKIEETQITDTSGSIVFHIVDENGNHREVKGTTYLGEDKQAQGISSESIRELPLIETLFSNRDKKLVEIEFDHFNKVYDRETDTTINKKAYEAVIQMQNEKKLSYRLSRFFNR